MPGPILSTGGNTWLQGIFVVALIALFCVLMSPQLTSMIVSHAPWLAPVLGALHHVLDKR